MPLLSVREFARFLNTLSSTFCYYTSLVLPFVILGLLAYINFDIKNPLVPVITWVWILLLSIIALEFLSLLTGKILFERELANLAKRKLIPIRSMRGVDVVRKNVMKNSYSILVSLILISIAFVSYLGSILYGLIPLLFVAIGLALTVFGIILLIRRPKVPVIEIGGLLDFYTPVEFKVYIDNMFQDTLPSILDPLSYLKFDDWIDYVSNYLRAPPGIDKQTILERAVEKIFLMSLLHVEFPEKITKDVLYSEIAETLSNPHDIEKLKRPSIPGLYSLADIERFMRRFVSLAPEVALAIERIFLTLRDNLTEFKTSELYFDVIAPESTRGLDGINILVFLFNNSDEYREKARPVKVHIIAPGFEPDRISLDVKLDPKGDFQIVSDRLEPYSKEGEDIVGKLAEILQIGDSIRLRLKPSSYGLKTITVLVEDKGTIITSRQLSIIVKRDLAGFFRKILGSGSMLSGVATLVLKLLF